MQLLKRIFFFISLFALYITFDITTKLTMVIKRISIDKTFNFAVVALNPIGYVWEKTFDRFA